MFHRFVAASTFAACCLFAHAARAQQPQLAITFDDLPAHGKLPPGEPRPEVVRSILSTLKQENLPPVYGFVNGFRIARFPYQVHILQAWHAAGQPLGNHTWSHPHLDKLSAEHYEANIARNEPALRSVEPDSEHAHWFRFPFLEEGNTLAKRDTVRQWLAAHNYRIAEISIDFQDYNWNEPYARCAARHDTAAIAHLHDTYLAAAAQSVTAFRSLSHTLYGRDVRYILLMHVGAFDAHMLPELIAQFRAEGFTFATLEDASADEAYRFDPHMITPGGSTFLEQVAGARKVNVPDLPDDSAELDKMCR